MPLARQVEGPGLADLKANRVLWVFLLLLPGNGCKADKIQDIIGKGEQWNAEAQFYLARCYATGHSVTKDEVEAVKWFRKAAEQNSAEAQFHLGGSYFTGQGVATNYVEAVKWWHKAAEQNQARAQYSLGFCYLRSEGVAKDEVEFCKWLFLSAAQGDADAKRCIAKLGTERSQEQIKAGKQRANDWLEEQQGVVERGGKRQIGSVRASPVWDGTSRVEAIELPPRCKPNSLFAGCGYWGAR